MINRKLGISLIILSILLIVFLVTVTNALHSESELLGCYERPGCEKIDTSLSLTHLVFGVVGFILALGFYLIFFYTAEQKLLERLEKQAMNDFANKKFEIINSLLDSFEVKILNLIREQDGIGQNTLVLRSDLSKSKVSEVIKSLESKNLVKKLKKGKYNRIYLIK